MKPVLTSEGVTWGGRDRSNVLHACTGSDGDRLQRRRDANIEFQCTSAYDLETNFQALGRTALAQYAVIVPAAHQGLSHFVPVSVMGVRVTEISGRTWEAENELGHDDEGVDGRG